MIEYSTKVISTEFLEDFCYRDGDNWFYKPLILEEFDFKPPVFIIQAFWAYILRDSPEYKAKHQLFIGGSGTGKSQFLATKILLQAQDPSHYFRAVYVRKTKAEIKNSTYRLFCDLIRKYGWTSRFRMSDSTYDIQCLTTGYFIFSAGLDDIGKLMGIEGITDIWIEEGVRKNTNAQVKLTDYTEILRRLRTSLAPTHVHSSFNPLNKRSFYYTHFEKQRLFTDVSICRTYFVHNPFLTEDFKQTLLDQVNIDADEAQATTYGVWADGSRDGKWVRTFKRTKHVGRVPYITAHHDRLMYDFNAKPYMTLLCGQVVEVKKRRSSGLIGPVIQVRIFKEFCLPNPHNSAEAVTKAYIREYPTAYGHVPVSFYGDASGYNDVAGYGGKSGPFITVENVLKPYTHNHSKQVPNRNPFIEDARELVEEIFRGKYDIEVLIDEAGCPNLIEDLEDMQEDIVGFKKEKDKALGELRGHCYSALSYFLCKLFAHLMKQRGADNSNQTGNE